MKRYVVEFAKDRAARFTEIAKERPNDAEQCHKFNCEIDRIIASYRRGYITELDAMRCIVDIDR